MILFFDVFQMICVLPKPHSPLPPSGNRVRETRFDQISQCLYHNPLIFTRRQINTGHCANKYVLNAPSVKKK